MYATRCVPSNPAYSTGHWTHSHLDLKQIIPTILEVTEEEEVQPWPSNSSALFLITIPCRFFCKMGEKYREGLNPWDSGRVGNGRKVVSHGQKRRNREEKGRHVDMSTLTC